MAKHRIILEIDDDGRATIQIGAAAPVKVVDYRHNFSRPVEAIDPGDMPPDDWARYRQSNEGDFIISCIDNS